MPRKLGGPTDLEPGTIVRVEWNVGEPRRVIVWGVVADRGDSFPNDLYFHTIIWKPVPETFDMSVGRTWWAMGDDGDSWRVGKRPPKEFWIELAKWRLLGDQQD